MGAFWFFGIMFGIVAFVVVVAVISSRNEKKRTDAWKVIAARPGMQFLGDENTVLASFGHLKMFQNGRKHHVWNAIAVDSGEIRIVVGDFRFVVGSGKNSHTHHQTICALESNMVDAPHCRLRPEVKLLDALGALFGGQDIDFSEDTKFSTAFVLQGEDEPAIRQMFDAEVRAWFAERAGRRFFFEALGDKLVFHLGKRVLPAEAPELMDQSLQIMKLLARKS